MYDSNMPSVRIDFGKGGVCLIQPKTVQFSAKHSDGIEERKM